ncbi:MAG: TIGR01440 family protein [Fibrobacter sp.]|uniref:TIGR01440 family protein n=1 Tax=Fibrobacter sp. TaxID=35828 RepID=UPI0025B9BAE0|nr:TIGR01440 family protein [Fibrobacter sp.]MBR4785675.1 TIGR01440 family protein [Fibrobacter sp.]
MAGITYEIEDKGILEQLRADATRAAEELVEAAHLGKGQIVVIGCSTSETLGQKLGSHSVPEAGKTIFEALQGVFAPRGIFIAAQCCEHLNRAIIIEREAVPNAEIVNVVPQPKAGGSFATACYKAFKNPVAIEHIKADAGLDIGGTLIGMHLKEVAVPLRLSQKNIGQASLAAARTRPKFIGGDRAFYDVRLKDGYPKSC